MLVVAVADAHIPERATAVPPQLRALLVPGKINHIASLGNVGEITSKTLLRPLGAPIKAVRGEFDVSRDAPLEQVLKTPWMNIGLVSGLAVVPRDDPDALAAIARKLDVDVLLWAGSHQSDAHELGGKFFVNPGSLTGAWTPTTAAGPPGLASFCLLDIQPTGCTVFFYSVDGGEVKVEKVTYKKQ